VCLRFARPVAGTGARLTTGSGGLTPGRAGFAPAGRQTKFHEVIASSIPLRPAEPGRNCPLYATDNLTDTDEDGRGDACECADQNGEGRNTVSDLVAINQAVFTPARATEYCDGNNDGECSVSDIVAASREIFSPKTSTCTRQPVPGP
jgi:hypothetical protein